MITTFIHSGDAGDVIFSLPAMLAKTGGQPFKLILGTKTRVRKNFDVAWSNNLMSLLRIQPYIADVWLQKPEDTWNVDCDGFRNRMFTQWVKGKTALAYTCDEFGISSHGVGSAPWITVDQPMHVDGCPVVVNRTYRYLNPTFPWRHVVQKYRGQMVFIGFPEEHDRFMISYGVKIPYCPTENTLEMARLLAGCRLFVGNQSLAHAIAEGMKIPIVLEVSRDFPTCIFNRPRCWLGFDQRVILPAIP